MRLSITSLNLDKDKCQEAKRNGHNLSEVCRDAISALTDDIFDDVNAAIKLGLINREINSIDEELYNLNNRIIYLSNHKKYKESYKQEIEDQLITIRNANQLGTLMQALNQHIISNHFSEEIIISEYSESIDQVLKIKPDFNISLHISRMKELCI